MRLVVIAEKNWLTKNVFELQAFSEAIAALGHDVIAIDYNEAWTWRGIGSVSWQSREIHFNVQRTNSGSRIELHRPRQLLFPGLSRISGALDFISVLREIIQGRGVDVIILYAVPTYGVQTLLLARKYGIPVVFRSIDMLPNLVPVRALKPITRLLERIVYRWVDGILTHTPYLAEYVISLGAKPQRVHLLLPPVELDVFHPTAPNLELARQWGISPQDRIILFVGRLFEFSGVPTLIHQFAEVAYTHPEYKLLVVGQGEAMGDCQSVVTQHQLDGRVVFTGYQPFEFIPAFINLAEVCVTPFEINDTTNNALPGKIAEYLACGKPVVCTPLRGTRRVYPDIGAGIVFTNLPDIMVRVAELMEDPLRRHTMGQDGLRFVRESFAWEAKVRELEHTLISYAQRRVDHLPSFVDGMYAPQARFSGSNSE